MKKYILDFMRRGIVASGFGPLVLAVFYLVLYHNGKIQTLTVSQVCTGILSLYLLAFIAGGLNVLYQIERLPLMAAITIHGGTLYLCYLVTYLVNDWLTWGTLPILVFSCIFIVGYLVIWVVILSIIQRRTARLNEILKEKHRFPKDSVR